MSSTSASTQLPPQLKKSPESGNLSQLILPLKSSFRSSDFERVMQTLNARDEAARRDTACWKAQCEAMEKKHGEAELEKLIALDEVTKLKRERDLLQNQVERAESDRRLQIERMEEDQNSRMARFKEDQKAGRERERGLDERYARLWEDFNKMETEKAKLGCKVSALEFEREKAERKAEEIGRRFEELNRRVSRLEEDAALLMSAGPGVEERSDVAAAADELVVDGKEGGSGGGDGSSEEILTELPVKESGLSCGEKAEAVVPGRGGSGPGSVEAGTGHKKTYTQDLEISAERPSSLMVSPKQIKNIKKRQRRTQDSEQASPAPPQKQCTFRSNVLGTVGLLSNVKLNNAHVALLKQTPFWLLIDAIRKGKLGENAYMKHDKPILAIIEKYDTNDSKFLIAGKKVALTRNDIRLIFGICCGNKSIGELKIKKKDVAFATRRGIKEARIGSKKIKDMINEILQKEEDFMTEEDIRDVVRLICMFICLTLFFSTSGITIAWTYVHCMENIEEIKQYDWAQSIADTLNASMHKFHHIPRDATGCVLALMFWFCEHTNLIARPTHESIPRLLNWNTSQIKKAFDDLEDLSNANITVNDNELQQTSQEDQVYTMAQPEVDDMKIIPHLMHYTQSPQLLAVQQVDDIPLTETHQTFLYTVPTI